MQHLCFHSISITFFVQIIKLNSSSKDEYQILIQQIFHHPSYMQDEKLIWWIYTVSHQTDMDGWVLTVTSGIKFRFQCSKPRSLWIVFGKHRPQTLVSWLTLGGTYCIISVESGNLHQYPCRGANQKTCNSLKIQTGMWSCMKNTEESYWFLRIPDHFLLLNMS